MGSLRTAITRASDMITGGAPRAGEPPLVRPRLPFLGHALAMGRDLVAMLRECQREHGDVFTLLVAGQRMTCILDPADFLPVLKAQDTLTFHEIGETFGSRVFGYESLPAGPGLDEVTGLYSLHLKAAALDVLTARMDARLRAVMHRFAGDAWRDDDLFAFTARCMFIAGVETLFGEGVDERYLADFRRLDRWFAPIAGGAPELLFPGVRRARESILARVAVAHADASAFIRAREVSLDKITSRRNRDHYQVAILWASQANTMPAAFWALAHVLAHPDARAAVTDELAVHGVRELSRLRRLQSCVDETLRLRSDSLTLRLVQRDCDLTLASGRSITLRAGDRVALCPQITHRDPEVFADPESFRWDRFLAVDGPRQFHKRGKRVAIPLMPYGGGVSMCPGRFFANNEVLQYVGLAVTCLDIELLGPGPLPPHDKRRAGLGVPPPVREVPCRIRRKPAQPAL